MGVTTKMKKYLRILYVFAVVQGLVMTIGQTALLPSSNIAVAQGSGGNPTILIAQESQEQVCAELKRIDPTACDEESSAILQRIVKPIMQVLSILVGAVSVVVLIAAGLLYVISAGDANNVKRAKDAILYAIIGLVIAFSAQAIVTFVLGAVG